MLFAVSVIGNNDNENEDNLDITFSFGINAVSFSNATDKAVMGIHFWNDDIDIKSVSVKRIDDNNAFYSDHTLIVSPIKIRGYITSTVCTGMPWELDTQHIHINKTIGVNTDTL